MKGYAGYGGEFPMAIPVNPPNNPPMSYYFPPMMNYPPMPYQIYPQLQLQSQPMEASPFINYRPIPFPVLSPIPEETEDEIAANGDFNPTPEMLGYGEWNIEFNVYVGYGGEFPMAIPVNPPNNPPMSYYFPPMMNYPPMPYQIYPQLQLQSQPMEASPFINYRPIPFPVLSPIPEETEDEIAANGDFNTNPEMLGYGEWNIEFNGYAGYGGEFPMAIPVNPPNNLPRSYYFPPLMNPPMPYQIYPQLQLQSQPMEASPFINYRPIPFSVLSPIPEETEDEIAAEGDFNPTPEIHGYGEWNIEFNGYGGYGGELPIGMSLSPPMSYLLPPAHFIQPMIPIQIYCFPPMNGHEGFGERMQFMMPPAPPAHFYQPIMKIYIPMPTVYYLQTELTLHGPSPYPVVEQPEIAAQEELTQPPLEPMDSPNTDSTKKKPLRKPRKPKKKKMDAPPCRFCKPTEAPVVYKSHAMLDKTGNTVCPYLQRIVCEICGETGKRAHTLRFCPKNIVEIGQNTGQEQQPNPEAIKRSNGELYGKK